MIVNNNIGLKQARVRVCVEEARHNVCQCYNDYTYTKIDASGKDTNTRSVNKFLAYNNKAI